MSIMQHTSEAFLGQIPQRSLFRRSLGEALAEVARRAVGASTAAVSRKWQLDRKAAENLRNANSGAAVITKVAHLQADTEDNAWDFWDALGAEVLGETRAEYDERKLRTLIESTANARSLYEERIARRTVLAERAEFVGDDLARMAMVRRGEGAD